MGNGVTHDRAGEDAARHLRARLLAAGTPWQWTRGHRLVHQGDQAGAVYLVERGTLKVTTCTSEGDEAIHAVLGPGDLVGELAALDGRAHAADVVALTTGAGRRLPASRFRALLADDVDAAIAVATLLAARIRGADRVRSDVLSGDVEARVARQLWQLSDDGDVDAATGIPVRISQDDLASWCGASRQAVNGALGRLRAAGLVRTARGTVFVLDRDGLLTARGIRTPG